MEKKAKVPKLRFPGFTGEWEERKLGEVAEFSKGNGYSKDDLVDFGMPIILYGRMYTKYQIQINDVDTFVNETKNSVYSTGLEVIVPASGETAEDIAIASAVMKPGIILGGDINIIYPISRLNSVFLALQISGGKAKREMSKRAQGKSIVHLHNADLREVAISIPEIVEQEKISRFFYSIDKLIMLQQCKLAHLQAKKKCLLQKMFPKKGERFPELRFPGFTGEWEQRKLGELMNVTSVKRIHQSDWTSTGVRFFRARDIVSESKGEKPEDILYISTKKYDEYSALSGKVKVGDLLVTGVGTIGVPMLIKSENPIYFKDGNIIWFQSANKIDGFFFYYTFISESVQRFIKDSAGIGTVGTYTIDSGKRTPIIMPSSVDEQQKIGEFFKSMDNLINLHQRKLIHLQTQKKALLQQMFV